MVAATAGAVASATATTVPGPAAALTADVGAFPGTREVAGASTVPRTAVEATSPPQGSAASPGASASHAPPESIPGTDAAIQRWFLDNDALKISFNDALLRAEQAVARGDAPGCQQLDARTRAMSAVLPALGRLSPAGQKLATAMQSPLTTFAVAATACLAKDFAAAQVALDSGIVKQADAQETVDEILDGDL